MRSSVTSVVTITLLATSVVAVADPLDNFCRTVESSINILADFTNTKCLPTAGSAKGRNSFILLSEKPVFSNEQSKKAWLIVACAAVGSELNKKTAVRAEELWFSDVARTKERTAFSVSAATCKSLQSKVYDGALNIEQMYSTLSAQLVRKDVKK